MRSQGYGLSAGSGRDMDFEVSNYRFGSVLVEQLLFLQDENIEILNIAVLLALKHDWVRTVPRTDTKMALFFHKPEVNVQRNQSH